MLFLIQLLKKSLFPGPTVLLIADRINVIYFLDEAHWSQTNLKQKIRIIEKGVKKI
jgi:hypothetical protein